MVASYGPGVPFPGQQPAQVTLADGQGKELVQGGCALCHGLDRVVATNRPKDQWRLIVDRMVYFGAPLTPEQTSGIVDYLAANYSPKKTAAK
jgi:mono/diheme cytochrome c family protein